VSGKDTFSIANAIELERILQTEVVVAAIQEQKCTDDYSAVPTFRRIVPPPSSGWKESTR
jgi:hypothetical protein